MFLQFITVIGNWFIPAFLLLVFSHGIYKKVPLYDTFVEGAKGGIILAIKLLPYVVGIYVAVGVLRKSGALEIIITPFRPILMFLDVPTDILSLSLVQLFSGPAALGLSSEIIDKFGPDSFVGRLSSTLFASCDTVVYIITLYFASVGIKNYRYSLKVGLIAAFFGFTASVIICKAVFL